MLAGLPIHLHQTLMTVLLFQTLQSHRQLAYGGAAAKVGITTYLQVLQLEITCYGCGEVGLPLSVAVPACAGLKLLWELQFETS